MQPVKDINLFHIVDGYEVFLRKFGEMLDVREENLKTYKHRFTQDLLKSIWSIAVDMRTLADHYRVAYEHDLLEDISSVEILARNIMEMYTVYFYLFVETEDQDIRGLRWYVYQLYGKKHALKMTGAWVSAKPDDKKSIEEIKEWIKDNPVFMKLDKKIQSRALDPQGSTLKPLGKIAPSYGIPERLFDFYYSLFSNTIHSNLMFLMASKDPKQEPINLRLKKTFIWSSLFTNMAMIDLLNHHPELESVWHPGGVQLLKDQMKEMKAFIQGLQMQP